MKAEIMIKWSGNEIARFLITTETVMRSVKQSITLSGFILVVNQKPGFDLYAYFDRHFGKQTNVLTSSSNKGLTLSSL